MSELHKKSSTKEVKKSLQLTEESIRQIVRDEIAKYMGERAKRHLNFMMNG